MGKNKVSKKIVASQNFVVPAGVTSVNITAVSLSDNSIRFAKTVNGESLTLDPFGRAFGFGQNGSGQLGTGDVTSRSSPVAVLGGLFFSKLGTGAANAYALTSQGVAYAWGSQASGELGVGDVTPRSSPVAVLGGLVFQNILPDTNGGTCYFLTPNGAAYSCGQNTNGYLGVGDVTPRSSPVAVLGGLNFSSIKIYSPIVLGLTTGGSAYAWGLNLNGNLGVGDVTPRSSPVAVLGGLTFQSVDVSRSGSDYCSFGITTTGVMYSWGGNSMGQLGVGDVTPRSSPVAVLGGLTFQSFATTQIGNSGSLMSVLGLTTDGKLYAWGSNTNGQLGVGDVTPRSSPVAVLSGLTNVVKIWGNGVGNANACGSFYALTNDGTLYAWGNNQSGCLGVGDTTPRSSPVAVLGGILFNRIISSNSGGSAGVLGIDVAGKVYGWGSNTAGNLGVGDTTARSSPVLVVGSAAGQLLAPTTDVVVQKSVTVIPGNTYAINLGQYNVSFGGQTLLAGQADYLILDYFS